MCRCKVVLFAGRGGVSSLLKLPLKIAHLPGQPLALGNESGSLVDFCEVAALPPTNKRTAQAPGCEVESTVASVSKTTASQTRFPSSSPCDSSLASARLGFRSRGNAARVWKLSC